MLSSILHFSIIMKSSLPCIIVYGSQCVPDNILPPGMSFKNIILKQKQWHLLDNLQLFNPSLLHITRCTQAHILFVHLTCDSQHITDASNNMMIIKNVTIINIQHEHVSTPSLDPLNSGLVRPTDAFLYHWLIGLTNIFLYLQTVTGGNIRHCQFLLSVVSMY